MKESTNTLHHIAFIVDGNRRWAKEKSLTTKDGHRAGYKKTVDVAAYCQNAGLNAVTFWLFSTENWNRSDEEVKDLMELLEWVIKMHLKQAHELKQRIVHLGRKDRLPENIINLLNKAESETNAGEFYVCLAVDYGGLDEVCRTVDRINSQKIKIDKDSLIKYSDTGITPYPCPEVIVRTSGEVRLSGFMLLQSGYSELFFDEKFFPALTDLDIAGYIENYAHRNRRFGS